MSKASEFATAVGRKQLQAAAGVKASAVSNAITRGWFPSSWFLAAAELAKASGVECDPALFGMVRGNNTHNVSAPPAKQGNETRTQREMCVKRTKVAKQSPEKSEIVAGVGQ